MKLAIDVWRNESTGGVDSKAYVVLRWESAIGQRRNMWLRKLAVAFYFEFKIYWGKLVLQYTILIFLPLKNLQCPAVCYAMGLVKPFLL